MPKGEMHFDLTMKDCLAIASPQDTLGLAQCLPQYGLLPATGKLLHYRPVDDIPAFVATKIGALVMSPTEMALEREQKVQFGASSWVRGGSGGRGSGNVEWGSG